MSDPALDFSIEAMTPGSDASDNDETSPWLRRRALGFGASDVPALLMAMGKRQGLEAPKYLTERTRVTNRTAGQPRIIAEKAGLVRPARAGAAASKGTSRERELLQTWKALLSHHVYADECETLIVPSTIRHADVGMHCAMPWVDRYEPHLVATLDGWAEDVNDNELCIELKCSAYERTELPWYWRDQVQAQLAVSGAEWGVLVCGEFWAAWHGNDGPIRVWPVDRDERAIEEIREVVKGAWALVEKLKEGV